MRADVYLVANGHYSTRARAQAAIKAGLVTIGGKAIKKPSEKVADAVLTPDDISAQHEHPYVSRGALKLVHALDAFDVDPTGRTCLDVGASTGGFTQVLCERGAARVYAVDVGRDQLHADLHGHPRIISMEGRDARTLMTADFDPLPDLVVCDASFISVTKVLAEPLSLMRVGTDLVTLVKPQFEVGKVGLGRGGIVKSEELGLRALDAVRHWVGTQGWDVMATETSPIKGGSGNIEYLLHARR